MPQFLFVVEIPSIPEGSVGASVSPDWLKFSNAASSILKTAKGTKQLQSNAWLLPAENSLPALAELCALAGSCTLQYSSLLLPVEAVVLALDVKPKS